METLERRAFIKGAATGTLAFTVGGSQVFLTPRQAYAQGVPLRTLSADEAKTLEALGETLVPGARDAGVVHRVSQAQGKRFVELDASAQHDFVDRMRQNKLEGWQGPPPPFAYTLLRADAVDVVYGTMSGYEALGIPYMAHIAPTTRW